MQAYTCQHKTFRGGCRNENSFSESSTFEDGQLPRAFESFASERVVFEELAESKGDSILHVNLKYFKNIPAIRGIQQISRPGNRTYINIKRILKYSQEQN